MFFIGVMVNGSKHGLQALVVVNRQENGVDHMTYCTVTKKVPTSYYSTATYMIKFTS